MSAQIITLPTQRNRNPHINAPEVVAFRRDVQAGVSRETHPRAHYHIQKIAREMGVQVTVHSAPMVPMQPGLNKMDRLAAIRCLQAWAAELGLTITVQTAGGAA